MALKTDLSDMSISSTRASIGKVKTTLRVWNDLDNTVTADPILEEEIVEDNVKIYVEGVDPTTLAERVKDKVKGQAQSKINYYENETEKIDNVTSAFQDMVTEVDSELKSKELKI